MDASIHSNLSDIFHATARRYRDRPALIEGERQLSYREMSDYATQVAHQFAAHGIGAGDQVGIALRHSIPSFTTMFALWMLNAVAVPIDFRIRAAEREKLVAEFDLAAVVQDTPALNSTYRAVVWNRHFEDEIATQSTAAPSGYCGVDHPATISLTSGTTGRPIGFVQSHKALILRMMGYSLHTDYPSDGRALMAFPLSFSASRNHLLGQLVRGTTVYFHPPTFGAAEIAKRLLDERITFFFTVPSTVMDLLEIAGERDTPLFPDLRVMYCGGAGMLPDLKVRAYRYLTHGFQHCFSSSLSGTVSMLAGNDVLTHAHTEGAIFASARVQIVDEAGVELPDGEVGIVRCRSQGASEEVYKAASRPSGDRIVDGWGYTGDLGKIDEEGFLTLVGRSADVILRSGINIYPAEIESALSSIDGVVSCAAVGFPDTALGEDIAVFVVTDRSMTEASLLAHAQVVLPAGKRPGRVIFMDKLPLNANGKVLKRDLRESLIATAE